MDNDKTAVLVLSYCLYKDGTRLSVMAEKSAEIGIATVCNFVIGKLRISFFQQLISVGKKRRG